MNKVFGAAVMVAMLLAAPVSASSFKAEIWKFNSGFGGGSTALQNALDAISAVEATETFTSTAIDYPGMGVNSQSNSLGLDALLGDDAFGSTIGNLTNTVMRISGTILPGGGLKDYSVGSDDGFLLTIGGVEVSRRNAPRGFGRTVTQFDAGSGPVSFVLTYFENSGHTGVEFAIDGAVVDQSFAAPVPLPAMLPALALVMGGLVVAGRRRQA